VHIDAVAAVKDADCSARHVAVAMSTQRQFVARASQVVATAVHVDKVARNADTRFSTSATVALSVDADFLVMVTAAKAMSTLRNVDRCTELSLILTTQLAARATS
jgi:hypothetical protein